MFKNKIIGLITISAYVLTIGLGSYNALTTKTVIADSNPTQNTSASNTLDTYNSVDRAEIVDNTTEPTIKSVEIIEENIEKNIPVAESAPNILDDKEPIIDKNVENTATVAKEITTLDTQTDYTTNVGVSIYPLFIHKNTNEHKIVGGHIYHNIGAKDLNTSAQQQKEWNRLETVHVSLEIPLIEGMTYVDNTFKFMHRDTKFESITFDKATNTLKIKNLEVKNDITQEENYFEFETSINSSKIAVQEVSLPLKNITFNYIDNGDLISTFSNPEITFTVVNFDYDYSIVTDSNRYKQGDIATVTMTFKNKSQNVSQDDFMQGIQGFFPDFIMDLHSDLFLLDVTADNRKDSIINYYQSQATIKQKDNFEDRLVKNETLTYTFKILIGENVTNSYVTTFDLHPQTQPIDSKKASFTLNTVYTKTSD